MRCLSDSFILDNESSIFLLSIHSLALKIKKTTTNIRRTEMASFKSSSPEILSRNRSRLQQVFGNKLNVEEKLQVLDALISTAAQSYESKIQGLFYCGICGKSYQLLSQYHGHLCNHKASKSQVSLRESFQSGVQREQTRFTCQLCDKWFYRRSDLRTHVATHLSLQGCVCEVCGHSFSHISNLIRHSHIHSGLKPYPCKLCGKRFRQTSALHQHRISRHNAQPIPCPAYNCDKKFRTPVIARRHTFREHPNVSWEDILPNSKSKKQRSFYCRSCGDQFQNLKHLKAHNLEHENEKVVTVDENFIGPTSEKALLLSETHSESLSDDGKNIVPDRERRFNNSSIHESDGFWKSNNIHEDMYNSDAHHVVSELLKIGAKLQDQDDSSNNFSESDIHKYRSLKKSFEDGYSFLTKSNDTKFFNENETQSCIFSGGKSSWHNTGSLNANLIELARNTKIHSMPGQVIDNEMNNVSSTVDCLLESINEINRREENLNVHNDLESEIKGRKQKDRCSDEDVLESRINEINCSNVTYDVDMGLCPDSPSDSLDGHQLTQLHCSNEADDMQCSDGLDNYKNGIGMRCELSQAKCINMQDNFPNAEPLMLSFGDSYSALLKEIGIVEEDINAGVEKLKTSTEQGHNESVEPLSSSFWNCYPSLPSKELVYNNEGDKVSTKVLIQETSNQSNEAVMTLSQNTYALVQELQGSNCNIDSGSVDNNGLTMEFADGIIPLLPNATNKTEEIIIYVAQDKEVQILPLMNASVIAGVKELISQDFRSGSAGAHCAQDREQFHSVNSPRRSKSNVQKRCLLTDSTRAATCHLETSSVDAKPKGSQTKSKCLTKQVAAERPAQGSKQEELFSSGHLTEDIKCSKKKQNRSTRECPECGKVFFKGSNLTQHLGLHFSNMKLYKCELCDQSFSWKSSLNKHMTSHAVILKQFLCDVCGKQYKFLDQVKQHKRRDHQSLRPHSCLICSKSFFRKYDLLIHERIHSNKKPYMCETCGKTFNHLSHVKRHENVHYKDETVSIALHSSLINL